MTREEAIEVLENGEWWEELTEWYMVAHPEHDKLHDAVDMAISALRQQETVTDSHQLNEPLTPDELREMDAPVWLRCYQVDRDGYWCLCKNGIIITPAGNSYDVSEIPHWAFYRQKPEEGTVCT